MKKMLIVIVAVVVIAAAGVFVFLQMNSGDKPVPIVRVEYSPGEYFTTNVKNSKNNHILKASIVLVVDKEGMDDTLKAENTKIRDTIIFILRQLDEDAIKAEGNQEKLRADIIKALNKALDIENFVEVRFNDFVMG